MLNTPFVDQCIPIQRVMRLIYNDTNAITHQLNDVVSKIKIITLAHTSDSRKRRKFFSFLGDIWEGLTCAPSENSFQSLKDHVNIIESNTNQLRRKIGTLGNYLNALCIWKITNTKLVDSLVQNNHLVVEKFQQLVNAIC